LFSFAGLISVVRRWVQEAKRQAASAAASAAAYARAEAADARLGDESAVFTDADAMMVAAVRRPL
jgi:hypothetical protein